MWQYEKKAEIGRSVLLFVFQFRGRIRSEQFRGKRIEQAEGIAQTDDSKCEFLDGQLLHSDRSSDYSSSGEEAEHVAVHSEDATTSFEFEFPSKARSAEGDAVTKLFHALLTGTNAASPWQSLVARINAAQNVTKLSAVKAFFLARPRIALVEAAAFLAQLSKELAGWPHLPRCMLLAECKASAQASALKEALLAHDLVQRELRWCDDVGAQLDACIGSLDGLDFNDALLAAVSCARQQKCKGARWQKHESDSRLAASFYLLEDARVRSRWLLVLDWLAGQRERNLVAFYLHFALVFGDSPFVPRKASLAGHLQRRLASSCWLWAFDFVPLRWREFSVDVGPLVVQQKAMLSVLLLERLLAINRWRLSVVQRLDARRRFSDLSFRVFHGESSASKNETLLQLCELFELLG